MHKGLGLFLFTVLAGLAAGCSDNASGTNATPAADAGTEQTSTLYDRLGKNSGIKAFIDTLVAEELKDPEIAAFFASAGTPGHPSAGQIKECLVLQVGNASGGPEKYPGTVSGGFTCRSMKAAHAGLGISAAKFDKFVAIAGKTAKAAGVSDKDVETIAGVLVSTKPDVVEGG